MPTKHSGFLIESSFGQNGNFELVLATRRGGFAHFWRDNDLNAFPWIGPQLFGSSSASTPSLLQNEQGPLEVFARSGSRIVALARHERWSVPKYFASHVAGNPAVIQTTDGELHMVVPMTGGGFGHFARPASTSASWHALPAFGVDAGAANGLALIQSNFGDDGNLEIVAVISASGGSFLVHFWRSSSGVWIGPNTVPLGGVPAGALPTGVPVFLQSKHGSKGNFEVVVPLSTGGLAHVTRDNDSSDLHWNAARTFATGEFNAVSVLQSGFGSSGIGNFELIGCVDNRVEHYWCDDHSLEWNGPTAVIYSEPPANPALTGEWRIDHSCEPVGIHAALLHTNRLLFFCYAEHDQTHGVSSVFNIEDDSVEHIVQDEDLFCAGHAFLADGRLLVAGGHVTGEKSMFLFAPAGNAGSWQQLPDLPQGRWYPTCTTLPDGTLFVLGGTKKSGGGEVNDTYQIFHPTLGLQPPQPAPFLNEAAPYNTYAFVFVLPSAKLFIFSADRGCFFDLTSKTFGSERLFCKRSVPRTYPLEGTSVLLPLMPDSNPPYRVRVLVIGGGGLPESRFTQATASCEILDLGDGTPEWQSVESMSTPRVMPDAVLLPDGSVLVMSGSSAGKADDAVDPVFKTEIYDPITNTWRPMGETRIPRLYHATALLLADGTVMTAGMDEEFNPEPFHYPEYRLEIFYPPYLFKGPRPQLQSVPSAITYGMVFGVQSDDAAAIQSLALVRAGSVTHSFNMDQRHVGLVIAARSATTIAVKAPPDANIAAPGCYLLFALNAQGVPSLGKFVFVS